LGAFGLGAIGGRAAGGEDDARGQRGQSMATQTAPKFGTRLRRRGQNAPGRWAGFFPIPIKIGANRTSVVRLCRTVRDAPSANPVTQVFNT
jgi:hypothetical protein